MTRLFFILLTSIASVLAKEADLPLCPTNIQFFPQNLPMHCRMPRSADYPLFPGFPPPLPPSPDPFYQSPPPDTQPNPIPIPPPFPGGPFPGAPLPGSGPIGMPMMPMPGPGHKLPVIVMPFYSPDPAFKKTYDSSGLPKKHGHAKKNPRRPRIGYDTIDTDTDTSSDTDFPLDTSSDTSSDNSGEYKWWKHKKSWRRNGRRSGKKHAHKSKKRHHKKKAELLTPVLQYVTKDGYVIFEKKITKDEAKDWLRTKTVNREKDDEGVDERDSNEEVEELAKNNDSSKEDNYRSNEDKDRGKGDVRQEVTTAKMYIRQKHYPHKPNLLLDGKPS